MYKLPTLLLALCLLAFIHVPTSEAAVIWVTHLTDDTDDSNGTCNLREAITAANTDTAVDACIAGDGDDTIYFSLSGTINLIEGLPEVIASVEIIGPGADLLTIDANTFDRVLYFNNSGSTWLLSGVTLQDGDTSDTIGTDWGGGVFARAGTLTISDSDIIDNFSAGDGGGLGCSLNTASVTLKRVNIENNRADGNGGGIYSHTCDITVLDSNISLNTADSFHGGINISSGDLIVRRSTLSGNYTAGGGGAIATSGSFGESIVEILHSTIVENSTLSSSSSGGLDLDVGIATLTIRNSIVAGNLSAGSLASDIEVSDSFPVFGSSNFIGIYDGSSTEFPIGSPNVNGNFVGTVADPIVANLLPLANNGGPTKTHKPNILTNEIIDKGSCSGEDHDQRGRQATTPPVASTPRIFDVASKANQSDGCDIGAFEMNASSQGMSFDIKALLDGPYTNVLMNTDLAMAGLIPSAQPYNTAPWNYSGAESLSSIPNDMVDWVLLGVSKLAPEDPGGASLIRLRSFYLENNGDLSEPENQAKLALDPGYYFLSIGHRNHLSVLSSVPVKYEWGEDLVYDFRQDGAAYSYGGIPQRDRGGLFTMWGGDGDKTTDVTAFDFLNVWLPANGGPVAYEDSDFNLDGSTTAFDFLNVWLSGNGQSSQTP